MVLSAAVTNSRHFQRDDATLLRDRLASVWTHLVFTPNTRDEVRVMGWVERTRSPFNHRVAFGQPEAAQRATSVHLQSAWERPRNAESLWTGFASFSARRRTTDLERVPAIVTERLQDGPVPDLLAPLGTDRAWSIGGKLTPVTWNRRHTPQAGVTLSGGSGRVPRAFSRAHRRARGRPAGARVGLFGASRRFRLAPVHAVGLRGRHGHPQSAPDGRSRSSLRARERTGRPTTHRASRGMTGIQASGFAGR